MSKYCAKCGAQMEDEDKVCGQCGAPVDGVILNKEVQKPKAKNNLKTIVIAAIAIALIAVGFSSYNYFTGYTNVLNKLVNAVKNNDVETISQYSSYINEGVVYGYKNVDEYYEDILDDMLDTMEEKVGTIKKITYQITDEMELSQRKVDDLKEYLIENKNINSDYIKKIVKIELKVDVQGTSNKTASFYVTNLFMIKEQGGWRFCYGFPLDQ